MKVILNTDIEKIGEVGDIVEVKPGYARNYLFPKKMALEVNQNNLYMMNAKKKKIQKKLEVEKLSAEELKQKLEEITITIEKKSGENDVLFGSVTVLDIENKLDEMGVKIDRKKFHLEEQIKRLGNYTCRLKLFKDVETELKIEVLGEGGIKAEKREEPEAEEKTEDIKEEEKKLEAEDKTTTEEAKVVEKEETKAAEEKEVKVVEKKEDTEKDKPKPDVKKVDKKAAVKPEPEVESEDTEVLPAKKDIEETKVSDLPKEEVVVITEKKEKKTQAKEKTIKDEKSPTKGEETPEHGESAQKSTPKKK